MAATTARKVFVNLPVRDLPKSIEFFKSLGFAFNAQFTNEKGACMILSEEGFVMLLATDFFSTFTKKSIVDAHQSTEAIVCLSAPSRAEVDELVKKALAAGGTNAKEPQDHGFMYGWSFYDLDGHHWEVMWMDPKAVQPEG